MRQDEDSEGQGAKGLPLVQGATLMAGQATGPCALSLLASGDSHALIFKNPFLKNIEM